MANKNGIRTDKFTSKAGDFQIVKPAPKKTSATKSPAGNNKGAGKKK